MHSVVATVRFENKAYCATKNNERVQPALILSISSSTDITLVVHKTAHGEGYVYSYIIHNYTHIANNSYTHAYIHTYNSLVSIQSYLSLLL